ncbi:PREDICTED: uncharacterized protein K02A2.6-like [Priapulus caudatus]|uniref:RNA-directed DNA polymerase n=1 Tax=Priapulus caudatus TaxID=37621 RepID=A0ABM1EWS8_PRICU|nr:PREDICTED: uncharacterized protein K02A2.6-like [Priapulus caudatus]
MSLNTKKFEEYFIVRHNTIFERAKFNGRVQGLDEPIDSFITALHTLAEHCEYGTLKEELIRDRIVVGIRDKHLSERMQVNKNLTLKLATDLARQSAQVKNQVRELTSTTVVGAEALAVHAKGRYDKKSARSTSQYGQKVRGESKRCPWCGNYAHNRSLCPAKNVNCRRCQLKGHFEKVCRKAKTVNEVTTQSRSYASSDVFLGEVKVGNQSGRSPQWTFPITVCDKEVKFRVDTGADVSVMSRQVFDREFPGTRLESSSRVIRGADHKPIHTYGCFRAEMKFKEKSCVEEVYIFEKASNLLSGKASHELGIVSVVGSVEKKFPSLFTGLGKLETPYEIKLREDVRPYAISAPRRIPLPLLPRVKEELSRLQAIGVISSVEEPTDWCAPIVVVPKPSGDVRLCVDLTKLNVAVQRERHMLPPVDYVLGQLANAKVFSKVDAKAGFHQIPLSEKSRKLTTFITPFGRFCFNRLPFGISSAPEHFSKRIAQILDGTPGAVSLMDDVIVFGRNQAEHDANLTRALTRLENAGITLNRDKCVFSQSSIKCLGQIVSADGITADPGKVGAVRDMPVPTNVSELRRFLGMVNQMGKFTLDLAELTKPMRDLLSKTNMWQWGKLQETAFEKIKSILSDASCLALYDPSRETKVTSDASLYGLGSVITQRDGREWRPVAYASRSLSPTEQRYAQIDKEALAIVWACEKFREYLIGIKFLVETDHKPLISLLSSKDMEQLPPRIQRFRMRLMRYSYDIVHVPGKELYTADALSRAPAYPPTQSDGTLEQETDAFVRMITESIPATDKRLENIRDHQQEDDVCREVIQYVEEGWPDRNCLKGLAKQYWPHRMELTVVDNLLCGTRIVIPRSLRSDILEKLHEGHQGIVKCRELAKRAVWWPGVSRDLADLVERCRECNQSANSRVEPLIPSAMPDRPWQKVATDLFELKKSKYLLVVDYYSRYIEVSRLESTSSRAVINHMKSIFARHGIAETVISDNGPQYAS